MREDLVSILINPYSGNNLQLEDGSLVDPGTGERFSIQNGIPVILREQEVKGLNRLYQRRYDWLSYFYDFMAARLGPFFGADKVFGQIAESMEVRPGDWMLETSIGTGQQVANLLRHGKVAERVVGLDISMGMLRRCLRNARRWPAAPDLVQGNAETVPFSDETFDMVFHIGGINFFSDKERAVLEMIRVAKPGARLYIGDETEKLLEKQPSVVNRYYQKADTGLYAPPLEFIPDSVEEVANNYLWDGKMYLISFRKPL